jgi:PadR family transcriptional regulator PadR
MPKRGMAPMQGELLQGTLDLLILRTLVLGPAHGHSIAYAIERQSEEVLQVEHGSLYPALHRLDRVLLGHIRKQPARAVLPADTPRPRAAC